ncbi:MAG: type IV pilus assembly protein PilM [Planctomycetota bacterium]|nr:type IV pilus assembly protein PilM [Planctomycetota bacterium]
MASNTVGSIDLGKSSLKAVRLKREGGNVEILAVDKVDYALGDGSEDSAALAREAFEVFVSRNSVKDPVVVAHPGQGTFSRFIKMPAFDDKKVHEMVGYEASQQIPFPLDEVIWDFHVVDREYLPGEEKEVALFAIRKEVVEDFLLEFANRDLPVESVSIGYLGVLNYAAHDLDLDEPSILLDIGASHTDLIFIDGNRFFIRPIPHSGNEITKAIQERFNLGFAAAEKLKLATSREPQKAVKIFQAVIQPKLKELVGEIHRSIGFYRSQHGEVNFSRLYLLGNGSKIIGIKRFLHESLNLQVEKVQNISHYRVSREVNLKLLQSNLPAFSTALGCGMHVLGNAICNVDLVPAEDKIARVVQRKKKHVFIAAGLVLLAMLVSNFLTSGKIRSFETVKKVASELVAELEEGEEAKGESLSSTGNYEKVVEEMKGIVGLRARVLKALRALDSVLVTFPNSTSPSLTLPLKAGAPALGENMEELLANRLWIPWARFERLDDPTAAASKKNDSLPTEPTYQFKVGVVVKGKDSSSASMKFVTEKFQKPLEAALKSEGLDLKPAGKGGALVQIAPEINDNLAEIFYSPSGKSAGLENGQEGRPFHSVEVSWILVTKPEPAAAAADEPGDEDDSEGDAAE